MKIKSLTIYCSASQKIDKKFFKLARETAEIISNYKIKVVYGGGNVGLMGEIANTLMDLNKEIIGIIPKFLVKKEKLNFKIKKLKVNLAMIVRFLILIIQQSNLLLKRVSQMVL